MSPARLSTAAYLSRSCTRQKGAEAPSYAEAGSEREALQIVMDLDRLLHEVTTLHGDVCLIGRLNRAEELKAAAPA